MDNYIKYTENKQSDTVYNIYFNTNVPEGVGIGNEPVHLKTEFTFPSDSIFTISNELANVQVTSMPILTDAKALLTITLYTVVYRKIHFLRNNDCLGAVVLLEKPAKKEKK
ncbi:MAG: hypothetical protein Q8P20_09000 [bacterium]|nr:hypothetical protein [bacterium]